ncbi:unnamed protein product [Amoebophrya sp. A120]|nr:unnamed protein product [Amoebophrya sp. A120]|eukprot:GSA120T00011662001.1
MRFWVRSRPRPTVQETTLVALVVFTNFCEATRSSFSHDQVQRNLMGFTCPCATFPTRDSALASQNKVHATLRYRTDVFADFVIRPRDTKPGAAVVPQHHAAGGASSSTAQPSTVLRRAPELEVARGGSAIGSPFRSYIPHEQELAWTMTAPRHFDDAQEVQPLQILFVRELATKGRNPEASSSSTCAFRSRAIHLDGDTITSSGTAEPGVTSSVSKRGNKPLQEIVDRQSRRSSCLTRTRSTTPSRNHVNLELHRFVKDWRDLGLVRLPEEDQPADLVGNPNHNDPSLQVCIKSYVK